MGAFPTYDFHHARMHIWSLLAKEDDVKHVRVVTVKRFSRTPDRVGQIGLRYWIAGISRLWEQTSGIAKPARRQRQTRQDRERRPTCRQSVMQGEAGCHHVNEGVIVF